MADYRAIMALVFKHRSYRQIVEGGLRITTCRRLERSSWIEVSPHRVWLTCRMWSWRGCFRTVAERVGPLRLTGLRAGAEVDALQPAFHVVGSVALRGIGSKAAQVRVSAATPVTGQRPDQVLPGHRNAGTNKRYLPSRSIGDALRP